MRGCGRGSAEAARRQARVTERLCRESAYTPGVTLSMRAALTKEAHDIELGAGILLRVRVPLSGRYARQRPTSLRYNGSFFGTHRHSASYVRWFCPECAPRAASFDGSSSATSRGRSCRQSARPRSQAARGRTAARRGPRRSPRGTRHAPRRSALRRVVRLASSYGSMRVYSGCSIP